jgi:hypothetical protein
VLNEHLEPRPKTGVNAGEGVVADSADMRTTTRHFEGMVLLNERVGFSPVEIGRLVRRFSVYQRGSRSFEQQHGIKQRCVQSAHKALTVLLHQAAPTGWTCRPTCDNNTCLKSFGRGGFPDFVAFLES